MRELAKTMCHSGQMALRDGRVRARAGSPLFVSRADNSTASEQKRTTNFNSFYSGCLRKLLPWLIFNILINWKYSVKYNNFLSTRKVNFDVLLFVPLIFKI